MAKDITHQWLKQAKADLNSAKNSFNSRDYYVVSFLSQQAVEKGLKALMIQEKGILLKTHNISRLAKELDLSPQLINKITVLEPVYQETRYPDVSAKIPAEEYEEQDANEFLLIAEEVLKWIQKKIK